MKAEKNVMPTDKELIDALEYDIKTFGAILIHDTSGQDDPEWPRCQHSHPSGSRGLGMLQGRRSLREALAVLVRGQKTGEIPDGATLNSKKP